MSRWLSQVTNYLEQLDDQAQDYVEENINAPQEVTGENEESSNLDSILAQRGLAVTGSEEEEEPLDFVENSLEPSDSATEKTAAPEPEPEKQASEFQVVESNSDIVEQQPELSGQPSSEESDKKDSKPAVQETPDSTSQKVEVPVQKEENPSSSEGQNSFGPEDEKSVKAAEKVKSAPMDAGQSSPSKSAAPKEAEAKIESTKKAPPPPAAVPEPEQAPKSVPSPKQAQPPPAPITVTKDPNPALVKEAKEAQKEVRTLRRHMLTLNKQLESVELEVAAQRKELEQAAVTMEKERAKAKEERDKERKRHAEELKAIRAQHDSTLMDQKIRLEKQLADMSQKLRDMEKTRMQEGGNWDKELQGAVEREQILTQKNSLLEDEKATLLSQINTLQTQQEALGDRIESLSQTADSAMEREREADERLDQALSVHAHQISQRQARESELERTIAELGAAMAAVRNKESSRIADYNKANSEVSDTAGENTSQDSGLRVRLDMALHDLETAQTNLELEKQRTEALQRELRDINGERTEEATNARIRQNKHDRQVAELTLQLTRLQSNSDNDKGGSERKESMRDDKEIPGLKRQIKELSEEVLKAREKIGGFSSELAALKSRLKGANDRAERAESALEDHLAIAPSGDSLDRMERGGSPLSGNSMRRRGGKSGPTSISSAMHLNKQERVGKAVDALDSFSVSTGKYLRYNPMARAAFIMYLLMLHLWTFVVIFFHAHNFEDMHRDDMPHGPDAIMQKQLGAGGQAVAAAVSAAKAAAAAAADAKQKQP